MKIELYVRHILQEFPDYEVPAENWTGRWVKTDKYGKFCPCKSGVARVPYEEVSNVMSVFLRSEEFGGLMYDPKTTAIYKLDKEAFSLVQNLQILLNEEHIEKEDSRINVMLAKHLNEDEETIEALIQSLQEINLW